MDYPIYIDTTKINETPNLYGSHNDFNVLMEGDGLIFPNTNENYIALVTFNLNYTWNNIDSTKYNNNTVRYSSDNGSTFKTITFADGNYSYSDISNYISNYLESQGDSKTGIQLYYVSSLKKIFIELESNYKIDFRSNKSFAKLLGFANSNAIITTSGYSNDTPDITNSLDNINVHCSLLSDTNYNGVRSDILYTFGVSEYRIGYTIPIKEQNVLTFHKMNNYLVKRMRIQIKDSLSRPVDLHDPITMLLFIRKY